MPAAAAMSLSAVVGYLGREIRLRPASSCAAWNRKFLRLLVYSGR
jgi:hypothetical protein